MRTIERGGSAAVEREPEEAWRAAEEAAQAGAAELRGVRERMRVSRCRAEDRRRCAGRALAAGQDEAAHALLEAAAAHDLAAAEAAALVGALERRQAALLREAEAREAALFRWAAAEPPVAPWSHREAA